MIDIFMNLLRMFLWAFASFALWFLDSVYQLAMDIARIDITKIDDLWNIWTILCLFLVVFVFFRVISMFFSALLDEEKLSRLDPIRTILGIACISLTVALMPMAISTVNEFTIEAVDNISAFVSIDEVEELKPSMILIGESIDYETIDINSEENGEYRYFPTLIEVLQVFMLGIVSSVMMGLIAFMFARRLFDLIAKILISPLPISGLVNPSDQSFSQWIRLVFADISANFVTILLLYVTLKVCMSDLIKSQSFLVQCVCFIGGLMATFSAPTGISQFLGSDISLSNSMMQLSSMFGLARGAGAGARAVMAAGSGAAMTAAAMGIYGSGRMLGGQGLLHRSGSVPGLSGIGGAGSSSGIPPKAFSEPPTEKQVYTAHQYGIDTSNMSKGEVSLAHERAGCDRSYWSGHDQAGTEGIPLSVGSSNVQNDDAVFASLGQAEESVGFGSFSSADSVQAGGSGIGSHGGVPQTKGIARAVSDYGNSHNTIAGGAARAVSSGSSHLYHWSAQRLSRPHRNIVTGNTGTSGFVKASNAAHGAAEALKPRRTELEDPNRKRGPEL